MLNFKKRETVVALEADVEGSLCARKGAWNQRSCFI